MRRTDRDPFPSSKRVSDVRRRITLALTFVALAVVVLAMAPAADAQGDQDDQDESAAFDIVAVSGFIDEIMADIIQQSISAVDAQGSGGVILRIYRSAAVIDDARLIERAQRILESTGPV